MERDDLKDFLKQTVDKGWEKFKEWNEEMDKYFEELEKKYEAAEKERKQKPWNNMNQAGPNHSSQNQNTQKPTSKPLSEEEKHYKTLELAYGADFEQIKSAYRTLVKLYHPDKFENDPEKKTYAQEVTRQINDSYFYFKKKFNK